MKTFIAVLLIVAFVGCDLNPMGFDNHPAWSATSSYATGNIVWADGTTYYRAIKGNPTSTNSADWNIGHNPSASPDWWANANAN
jgi:hypothetical protein